MPAQWTVLVLLHQDDGEEEETDELVNQVLDEIGISATTSVSKLGNWLHAASSTVACCRTRSKIECCSAI